MLDSGAMYRAVTLLVLQEGRDPMNEADTAAAARRADIQFDFSDGQRVLLNNMDVTDQIRTVEVTRNIAPIAGNPKVRAVLVEKQQQLGKNGGIVMEGRDIGTVVFPDAELKVYMKASIKERAKRRLAQLAANRTSINLATLEQDIRHRDESDMNRQYGALKIAQDALIIDTSTLTLEDQVKLVVDEAKRRGA